MTVPLLMVGNFLSGSVFTRGAGEELCARLRQDGWEVITTSAKVNRLIRLVDMLRTVVSNRDAYRLAYVEVYSGLAFGWAELVCAALRSLRKPYLLALHGGGLPEFYRRSPRRVSRLVRSARAVVTPSKWIAEVFQAVRPDILYLPNAIDLPGYPFRLRSSPEPKLVWLRAFHTIYQPWMAVEALAGVRRAYPDARLLMVGPDKRDGSLDRTCEAIAALGLQEAVDLPGGVSKREVPAWLNRGEIFLNTTRFESFGVSVLEAAACGLPVVTTNVGELPYLWEDGEDMALVSPDSPEAMARAVLAVLEQPGLAGRFSTNARRKAESFDWSVLLPRWQRLFIEHGLP